MHHRAGSSTSGATGGSTHDLAVALQAGSVRATDASTWQSSHENCYGTDTTNSRAGPSQVAQADQGIACLIPIAANLSRMELPSPVPAPTTTSADPCIALEEPATSRDPSMQAFSSDDGAHGGSSVQCSAKKRGRAPTCEAEDDERSLSVQERNRQAQARFRQRQKDKMSVLEAHVKELKADKIRLQEENRALNNRKSILEKVLALKEEQIQVLQNGAGIFHGVTEGAAKEVTTSAGSANPLSQSSGITSDQLIKAWKDCVKQLSTLLLKLDSEGESSGYVQQIEQLMSSTASVCRRVSFENPNAAKVLVCTRFHDVDVSNTGSHWAEVVKQLSLSTAQKEEIVNLSRTYRSEMATLKHQRHEYMAAMARSQPDLFSCAGQCRNSLESGKVCSSFQEMLRQEHQVHSQYAIAVLDKVFSRLQLAQASVTSYPFFPDALQMSRILEAETQGAASVCGRSTT
jgi:hypothetical protein